MAIARKRSEVEAEIKEYLGIVPGFMKDIPEAYLDFEWELFRSLQLGETLIPNKYKELMGVALHLVSECKATPINSLYLLGVALHSETKCKATPINSLYLLGISVSPS